MPPPTIRDHTPADRDAVVALGLRAWAPVFVSLEAALRRCGVWELQFPDGWEVAQAAAVADVCDTLRVWVADVDGAVAGFAAARLQEDMGEIVMLAVDPPAQRRGIGGLLTGVALDWMRDSGATSAMVETGGDPGHAPARAAYRRSGFVELPVARYFRAL